MANVRFDTDQSAQAWEQAAAARKYGVHNGKPYVGAEGHVVPLTAPDWFAAVPEGSRGTVFQALAEYIGNRVAQPTAKAKDATHGAVVDAAQKALTNGFEPSRQREKDPVDAEIDRMFRERVTTAVKAKKPDASEADIDASVAAAEDTPRGKEILTELRTSILDRGTYTVTRKGKAIAGGAVEIEL